MLVNNIQYIRRKSLLYKTEVEYGDYTINHVLGCAHGCMYPCYAFLMAKRFGKVKTYEEWIRPKIVSNAIDLLKKELPRLKEKIKFVHFCFSTDPFPYGYKEISHLSIALIRMLNDEGVKCTALTKGCLPTSLSTLSKENEYGITLVSLDEMFRKENEPFSAVYGRRINALYTLHEKGCKTWVSIEPYPTPNIIKQDFKAILNSIKFVDKIIFGKLNYNPLASNYPNRKEFFNNLSRQVIEFCTKRGKVYHIKDGTASTL